MWRPPFPYPDELAYSVFARFLRSWGYQWRAKLLASWLPHCNRKIAIECPADVAGFARMLSKENLIITAKHLAQDHTLLPYFVCFEDIEARRLITGKSREAKAPSYRMPYLVHSMTWEVPSTLRFCLDCLNEDLASFGETYWHRAHQLPGVVVCIKHKNLLHQSSISRFPVRSTDYLAASTSNCLASRSTSEKWLVSRGVSQKIAERSIELLSKPLGRPANISVKDYRRLIVDAGYGKQKNRIDASRLDADFKRFMRQVSASRHNTQSPWWHPIFRHAKGRASPLQHILFRVFLQERNAMAHPTVSQMKAFASF